MSLKCYSGAIFGILGPENIQKLVLYVNVSLNNENISKSFDDRRPYWIFQYGRPN